MTTITMASYILWIVACLSLTKAAPTLTRSKRETPICNMPSYDQLKDQLVAMQNSSDPHETVLVLPPKQQEIQQQIANDVDGDFIRTFTHLYGEQPDPASCPIAPSNSQDADLDERSTCPWYYVINHDPSRYPRDLAEAKCKCTMCAFATGNQCEQIKYHIRVLRQKECVAGIWVYEQSWESVSVGCTCAVPKTVTNGTPVPTSGDDNGPPLASR